MIKGNMWLVSFYSLLKQQSKFIGNNEGNKKQTTEIK